MKVAILCSGLGHVRRGHEVFIRQVFDLLRDEVDVTLFKGGGPAVEREVVVPHVPRYSKMLDGMHVVAAPKWRAAVEEDTRLAIEMDTFARGALLPLLEGGYDVIHCLEREVADWLYGQRLLFAQVPRFVFSNGGALPAKRLPRCDLVQEHTRFSMQRGAPQKSVLLPHGVDLHRFDPEIDSGFRAELGIPDDVLLVLSVGTICYWHKRMDHLIEEVAQVEGAHLVVAGQRSVDAPAIEELGRQRLGDRVRFVSLGHDALPAAYRAADVFALASLFETFGIVYIEAMAMRLPVIATDHENQRAIIEHGVFVDMRRRGALAAALRGLGPQERRELGRCGRQRVEQHYDLRRQKADYIAMYERAAAIPTQVPRHTLKRRLRGLFRR